LVKPKPDVARQEAERRRQEQRRQQEAQRAREQREEQTQQTTTSEAGASTQQADLQSQIQLLQHGVQRARTLNIGPIRDQIESIYKAQQEGKISIGEVSVAVNFRVREDGAFTHVHLVESSGIPEVDNAALIIVDELGQLRSLAPLQKTDSVTLRLTIGQEVELRTTVASPSEAVAAEQVNQLNGLLMAARLWTTAQKQARVAQFLSTIEIKQAGVNIVASARIPRDEAGRLLKKQFGSGS
jgi:TonB family protein